MPRANRNFVAGQVWHLTHRCHKQEFLLSYAKDRQCWLHWLFEARKRYGLCVLDYIVTHNHVHLLVKDRGRREIARSMQLIAGQTGGRYNRRRGRAGAFWQDRYHATAVETGSHLRSCVVYIDLNMVRAGVVDHPSHWRHSGYNEIQSPPERYRLIDLKELSGLCSFDSIAAFQSRHRQWVESKLNVGNLKREPKWSEARAVGGDAFRSMILESLARPVSRP